MEDLSYNNSPSVNSPGLLDDSTILGSRFLLACCSAEIFYLLIHQKHIFLYILEHVIIFALKSLSVNFYISGWASIDGLFSSEWITFFLFLLCQISLDDIVTDIV